MDLKSLYKEFVRINEDRNGVYEGQAILEFPDGPESPLHVHVVILPIYGPFFGGKLVFDFVLPPNYPNSAPTVKCLTPVFHPNINNGSVCFSMFQADFNSGYRFEQYVNGLLWLLQNPNPDSCLNSRAAIRDMKEFTRCVQMALRGLTVRGTKYQQALNPKLLGKLEQIAIDLDTLYDYARESSKFPTELSLQDLPDGFTLTSPIVDRFVKSIKELKVEGKLLMAKNIKHRVIHRANFFGVSWELILKELVFAVKDKLVMVICNGMERVDVSWLAQFYGVDDSEVRLAPLEQVKRTGWEFNCIPAFAGNSEVITHILVDKGVMETNEVYTSAGVANWMLNMEPIQLLKVLDEEKVKVVPLTRQHIEKAGWQKNYDYYFSKLPITKVELPPSEPVAMENPVLTVETPTELTQQAPSQTPSQPPSEPEPQPQTSQETEELDNMGHQFELMQVTETQFVNLVAVQ